MVFLGISAAAYYLYYGPAHVSLSITDPPPEAYDSSIQAIYVSFTKVEIHTANAGNESGWYTLLSGGTINLLTVLNGSRNLGFAQLPPGKYTEIRLFTSEAIITINGTDVTYTIPNGTQAGFKIVIIGGGLQIFGGQTLTVLLDLSFRNSEIMNNPTKKLTPVATAKVV